MASEQASDLPHSVYDSLDLTRRSIRLIRLLPAENDDDPICCELYTAQLTPELQFAALSYVWGTSSEMYYILANEIKVKVTSNLYCALKYFRKYDMLRSEDNRLPLWVDALCINQNDTQERNHQVAHMGDIYRHAKPVLSWLGYRDSGIRVAFDAIRDIASSLRPLQQPGDNEGGEIDMERGVEWLVNHRDFWQIPQNSTDEVATPWLAITSLAVQAYWGRTWIVQELVLANINTHYFVHGKATLSCRDFSMFSEFLIQLEGRKPLAPPTRSLSFTKNQWDAFAQKSVAKFPTLRLVLWLKQESASVGQNIIFNLALHTSATEPRDMVYGLAGLITTINPDYNKGVGEIYLDWAQGFMQSLGVGKAINLLLRYSGLGVYRKDPDSYGLPTWLPRLFSLISEYSVGGFAQSGSVAIKGLSTSSFPILDPGLLVVDGMDCDKVRTTLHMERRWDEFHEPNFTTAMKEICTFCRDFMHRVDDMLPEGTTYPLYHLFLVLFKGWDTIQDQDLEHTSQPHSYVTQAFRYILCHGESELDTGNDQHDIETASSLEMHFRDCSDVRLNDAWNQHAQDLHVHDSLDMVARSIMQATWASVSVWKVFSTCKGHLGVGPLGMREDDRICALGQCETPAVLRKCGEDRWDNIGSCWVLGLMNGEAQEMLDRGEISIETFVIQ
ncbi:putative Heterokaryon incompatibility domain-containing protein [Seiridium cardinale]